MESAAISVDPFDSVTIPRNRVISGAIAIGVFGLVVILVAVFAVIVAAARFLSPCGCAPLDRRGRLSMLHRIAGKNARATRTYRAPRQKLVDPLETTGILLSR